VDIPREDREHLVSLLSQEYPKAFFIEGKKRIPLKHNIEDDLRADLKRNASSNLGFCDLDETIAWYQNHVGYIVNCSTPGAIRIDLEGNAVGKVTEAEAADASQDATKIFAEITTRKKLLAQGAAAAAAPAPAVPKVQSLSVDTNLNTTELLAKVQEQLAVVKGVFGQGNSQFAMDLIRPALRLMIDELNAVVVRVDKGEM
jgi:sRNA-binding protein